MVRPVVALLFFAALAAGCTVPQFDCGHPVPCARGSVQSCISHDRARCRYLFSDGTTAECSSCDDCFAAEREIIAWCGSDDPIGITGGGGGNGGGASSSDLARPDEPRDMSVANDLATPVDDPLDLALPSRDLARPPVDDMTSSTTDLACLVFGYACNGDPTCCAQCCAGGCTQFGYCALQ